MVGGSPSRWCRVSEKHGGRNKWEVRLRVEKVWWWKDRQAAEPEIKAGQGQVCMGLEYRVGTLVSYRRDREY